MVDLASKKIPTDPWNIPKVPQNTNMKEFPNHEQVYSFFWVKQVCSTSQLECSLDNWIIRISSKTSPTTWTLCNFNRASTSQKARRKNTPRNVRNHSYLDLPFVCRKVCLFTKKKNSKIQKAGNLTYLEDPGISNLHILVRFHMSFGGYICIEYSKKHMSNDALVVFVYFSFVKKLTYPFIMFSPIQSSF